MITAPLWMTLGILQSRTWFIFCVHPSLWVVEYNFSSMTNKNVFLIAVFCKVFKAQSKRRGEDGRKEGRCGWVEVRDPETDETRGRGERTEKKSAWGKRRRRSLVHSLSWLTRRREGLWGGEREAWRSAQSERISVWVASLIRRCCQGPQSGGRGDPPSSFSSSPHRPPRSGKKKKRLMSDSKINTRHGPQRQPCKMMHAGL